MGPLFLYAYTPYAKVASVPAMPALDNNKMMKSSAREVFMEGKGEGGCGK